jgi:beta-glucosidase
MAGPNFAFSVVGTDSDVYQGHLASAVGSGGLSNSYLATPFQALSLRAAQDGSMFRWIMNDTYTESSSSSSFGGSGMGGVGDMAGNSTGSQGGPSDAASSSTNASMPANADGAAGGGGGASIMGSGTTVSPSIANYASGSEVCLVFLNSWSGEGADRSELYNRDQDILVNAVAENCNNTIVVINTSGPRLLDQWVENDNVTAIVYGGYLGQESGNAIVDVLYGDVNPNGKLTYTIAKNETDYPVSICDTAECNFDEGVHIDYRYFDAMNVSIRYPFGHGLSYTTFQYGNVSAVKTDEAALASKYPSGNLSLGGAKDLFDDVISIHFTLKNTGEVDGAEVAQLYVQYPSAAKQPVRQLRGFEKVTLSAGQQKDTTINIRRRDISFWDTFAQKWALASGTYTFSVGSSSRDLRDSVQMSIL